MHTKPKETKWHSPDLFSTLLDQRSTGLYFHKFIGKKHLIRPRKQAQVLQTS